MWFNESQDTFFLSLCVFLQAEPSLQCSVCWAEHIPRLTEIQVFLWGWTWPTWTPFTCSAPAGRSQTKSFGVSLGAANVTKPQHLQGLLGCGAGAPPTWSLQTKQMTKNSSLQMWNFTKSESCTLFSHYVSSLIPSCIPCLLPLQAQLRIKRRCLSLGKMF